MHSAASAADDGQHASSPTHQNPPAPPARADLRAIFEHFDHNKDGRLSPQEMGTSLDRMGLTVPPAQLAQLMSDAGASVDGLVNYEGFVGLYRALLATDGGASGGGGGDGGKGAGTTADDDADADPDLREAFGVFDTDGDGLISAAELHAALKAIGVLEGRNLADCVAMIRRVDSDGNGQVDFQEFKNMMA